VKRAADSIATGVRSAAEGAQRAARASQDTVRTGLGTASEIAQRSTEHVVQLFSASGKQTQEAAEEAAQRMQAVAQSSTALVRGLQEVSRAYFEMTQDRFQKNVEAFAAFSLCRSVPEFVEAQTSLVRQNVDLTLENGQRLAQLSVQVIEEATHTVAVERGPKSDRAERAA
jgi:hypothetical protein